jgi:hypothetical protein
MGMLSLNNDRIGDLSEIGTVPSSSTRNLCFCFSIWATFALSGVCSTALGRYRPPYFEFFVCFLDLLVTRVSRLSLSACELRCGISSCDFDFNFLPEVAPLSDISKDWSDQLEDHIAIGGARPGTVMRLNVIELQSHSAAAQNLIRETTNLKKAACGRLSCAISLASNWTPSALEPDFELATLGECK